MVDVHAPRPLLPLPFSHSQTLKPEADFTWKNRQFEQDQDWSFERSYSTRSNAQELEDQRVGFARETAYRRPSLPYPSPLSLPNGREHDLAVNRPMSSEYSNYPSVSSSFNHKLDGGLAKAVHQDLANARQRMVDPLVRIVSSKPASPVFQQSSNTNTGTNSIVSYLQLPSTITTSQGSLSEFAAQLTCLFWFESSAVVASIEKLDSSPALTTQFIAEAYPATGFMKWVTTILSTTQVTQNVILLALLFIYRLKKQCPGVKGKLGSEYRLLTVALMLGNKFLDDNTYTNKTWAEVSGISFHEIHVMEVEFLSHMKYNLYTSKEQWDRWHQQLAKFWKCFDRARQEREGLSNPTRPTLQIPHPLPSPPGSTHASPPYVSAVSPSTTAFTNAPILHPYSASDYAQQGNGRKRSYDPDVVEPPAKRQSRSARSGQSSSSATYSHPSLQMSHNIPPILPVPHIPSPTTHQGYNNARVSMAFQPSLPIARSTPPPTGPQLPSVNWLAGLPSTSSQQHLYAPVHSTSEGPSRQHTPTPAPVGMARIPSNGGYHSGHARPPPSVYPLNTSMPHSNSFHHEPSPLSAYSSAASFPVPSYSASHGSSSSSVPYPMTTPQQTSTAPLYPSAASHTITQDRLSPSHYLTSRSSPYRPVRNMHTLLVPPPSTNMPQHPAQISQEQMRWQPLGKNNPDERTGRVPYLHREAWPQTHQFNQWPSLYTNH